MAIFTAFSQIGTTLVSAALASQVHLLLKDGASLYGTIWVTYKGSFNRSGSATSQIGTVGANGYDDFSDFGGATEADAVANTTVTTGKADIALRRKALRYDSTDMADILAPQGGVDTSFLVMSVANSFGRLFAQLTASTQTGFIRVGGTTTAVATIDTFRSTYQVLMGSTGDTQVPGPYLANIKPKQWTQIMTSLAGQSNNVYAYTPRTREQLLAHGDNYKGNVDGVEVWTSEHVEDDGTDYAGALWGPTAIAWKDAQPQIMGGINVIINMGQVTVEVTRAAANAVTEIIGHVYIGMTIMEDGRGIKYISGI